METAIIIVLRFIALSDHYIKLSIKVKRELNYMHHSETTSTGSLSAFMTVRYALLMRANKPKTAVQSSTFLLTPHGVLHHWQLAIGKETTGHTH